MVDTMTNINIVTSFNETIYNSIGHHFLNSIREFVEPSINVNCYYHNLPIEKYSIIQDNNFKYSKVENIKEYNKFLEQNENHNGTEGGQIPYSPILDILKWGPKIFALTDCAESNDGWLIWLDADSYINKRLSKQDLLKLLPEKADIVHAGIRVLDSGTKIINTCFTAFNLNHQPVKDLLNDLKDTYISGEAIQYREWHDAFVLDRLIKIYQRHGLKVTSIDNITDTILHFEGNMNPATLPLRDSKGNRLFKLSNTQTSPDIMPNRYNQLKEIIEYYKPKIFLEVGTWNGGRAIEMALAAFKYTDTVAYYGYDLFEDGTVDTDLEEFNVKAHNTLEAVDIRLNEFKQKMEKENKTFTFVLTKGNSRGTLKQKNLFDFLPEIDLALIGGGNSIPTVQSDYDSLKHVPVIVMDHYFTKDKDGNDVQDKYKGVNQVVDKLDKKLKNVLPSGDTVRGGGHTHLALIRKDNKVPTPPKQLLNVPIVINPRDCVPKDYIRNNIRANLKLIPENKWLKKFKFHKENAIIVSGGPYTDFKEVHACIKNNPNSKVIAVKHSYPKLLEHNIKPWACIVLDPRPITGTSTHGVVRKDLFKTIDPTTKFFVASTTDPSVTEHLIANNANIYGWHAFTESLRDDDDRKKPIQNNTVQLKEELGIPKGATLITGGTCAAMRALGIMHTMGFRYFDLFGYDSSMEEPTSEMKKETTGADDEKPRPKYFQVGVKEKNFWTTGELLAMAQDCEKIFNEDLMEMNLTYHGKNTLIAALWELSQEKNKHKLIFERDFK